MNCREYQDDISGRTREEIANERNEDPNCRWPPAIVPRPQYSSSYASPFNPQPQAPIATHLPYKFNQFPQQPANLATVTGLPYQSTTALPLPRTTSFLSQRMAGFPYQRLPLTGYQRPPTLYPSHNSPPQFLLTGANYASNYSQPRFPQHSNHQFYSNRVPSRPQVRPSRIFGEFGPIPGRSCVHFMYCEGDELVSGPHEAYN